jgi:hypothetical protein
MAGTKELEATNAVADDKYVREDWTLFRSIRTISQLSGVPPEFLRRLVAKELTDNGLDASGACKVGVLPDGGFYVEDEGPGISGEPEDIARLFSFRRPLVSSKVKRLPVRGALGNGLRVVAGAVFASAGSLRVITNGRALDLSPQESGETLVTAKLCKRSAGTRIEVRLGDAIPKDADFLEWAETAILAAGEDPIYSRKTSPWWYDSDSFFELLKAAGERTVRDVMQDFDGSSGRAGEVVERFRGRTAASLTYAEAEELLELARSSCEPIGPQRLAPLKKGLSGCYAKVLDTLDLEPGRGSLEADLPYTVEAWCNRSCDAVDHVTVLVNRTPVTGHVEIVRAQEKTCVTIFGCNLGYLFTVGRKPVDLVINVQIPYMPITSNGKEPDLELFLDAIRKAVGTASKKCQRANPSSKKTSQNAVILDDLARAIGHASGSGKYRFSLRQLFYAIRPQLLEALGNEEPGYDWFAKVIAAYENERGDIPGLYRDDRGVLYHPHLRTEIPLGTLAVETYERPQWTFNKILYCEKEGFFPILQGANWPERHDCALLTSKGQATKAAKDIIDLLGETGEDILFYVIHDGDAYGTVIVQALQEATRSRPGRRVQIINLGLEPEEGLALGLPVEVVKPGKKRKPVGRYVAEKWAKWLQTNRIELNAMTTPEFIAWLDQKMAEHGQGKVVPPLAVMRDYLAESVRRQVEASLRERILREAGLAGQVQAAMSTVEPDIRSEADGLDDLVRGSLARQPTDSWRAPIERVAAEMADRAAG